MDSSDHVSPAPAVTDPAVLRRTLLQTLDARTTHRGEIVLPCIPEPLEHYIALLRAFFANLGKPLSSDELDRLRELLRQSLEAGFQAAADAKLIVTYQTSVTNSLRKNLECSVATRGTAEQYQGWGQAEDGDAESPFGSHPDARVIALLDELGDPAAAPILDVGAGTGRNALPLARRGHPVEAIEPAPQFAEALRRAAQAEGLAINVVATDFVDTRTTLAEHHFRLAILAEVVPHFRSPSQLRELFERMCETLTEDGLLVLNLFLCAPEYEPDALARQMAEVGWSALFTRDELARAMAGLPLTLVSDESVVEYERAHLPASAWPPTAWFADWASGRSLFPIPEGRPPAELRWILLRRSG